jgi:YVTN family beta-propeller protein
MRTRGSHHVVAGHRGGTSARWRRAAAVAAAAALPLAACAATALPASAAGGYTVTATIGVGSGPDGVAVDPATRTAYVTNVDDDTVSVIDEAAGTVTATIGVGGGPFAVAVDPAAHTAYVANLAGTVSVIDEAAGTVTATVPVGADPSGVAVDPSAHTAYVTNGNASTVSVISAALPAPVTTVTSSRNPSPAGQNVTFTATVGPADGGTITFSSGSRVLCRAVSLTQVSGRTHQAACTTRALPAGHDTVTAVYPGDASYATSAGLLTQTVTRAPTALTASTGLSPQQAFTLTATLTASGRPLSGQPVSFSTGRTHLCTPHTSTRGVATCVLTGPQTLLAEQDNDTIRASYPGSTSYRPSSATATFAART